MAATTYMRSFVDFDYVNIVLLPLFLFSGTFFPLEQYSEPVQWIVRCTPLYQGVALERGLAFGEFSWGMLVNVVYLVLMGVIGLKIAGRRLALLLQP
jgi:lipooligosaccharide transport system permease protein